MKISRKTAFVCVILIFTLALTGCSLLPKEETRRANPVVSKSAEEEYTFTYCTRGDMELTKKLSATYVPIQKYDLYFEVPGEKIDEMYVKVGDTVKKGELLGQLRLEDVDERIADCEAAIEAVNLRLAALDENRQLELKRQSIIDPEDDEAFKSIEIKYAASRLALEDELNIKTLTLASLNESRASRRIYSPIDGTVTYVRRYGESSVSSVLEKAVTVADSTMSLFLVSTEHWQLLPEGTPVTVTVSRVEYDGVVTSAESLGIEPGRRAEGEKASVYITLTGPASGLEDNDKGSFTLLLDKRENVLRITKDAVSKAGDSNIVYYLTQDGIRSYKTVTLGLLAGGMYEVLDGLEEGEKVLLK